jgi:hypothetical protein
MFLSNHEGAETNRTIIKSNAAAVDTEGSNSIAVPGAVTVKTCSADSCAPLDTKDSISGKETRSDGTFSACGIGHSPCLGPKTFIGVTVCAPLLLLVAKAQYNVPPHVLANVMRESSRTSPEVMTSTLISVRYAESMDGVTRSSFSGVTDDTSAAPSISKSPSGGATPTQ